MATIVTSGESSIETSGDDAVSVLEVSGLQVVNGIVLINEGDFPGFWRLASDGYETPWARLPAGGGEPGERTATLTIPCRGFSGGRLEVKRGLLGGNVTGLFAFGMA